MESHPLSTDSELDALALDVGRLEERISALERRQRAVDAYVEDLRTNGPRHRVFGRPPSPYELPMLTELPTPPATFRDSVNGPASPQPPR